MRQHRSDPLVVAICGSRGDDSVTRRALSRALSAAADAGARTELLDLREFDLPMLDPDADPPGDAARLNERLAAADALLLGTPMYNGSYASPLKTAIDHSDPGHFEGLPVGLVGVAGGRFPVRALDHLRAVASHMGARVLPDQVAVAESHAVGESLPEAIADRLDDLGEQIADAGRVPDTGSCRADAPADD